MLCDVYDVVCVVDVTVAVDVDDAVIIIIVIADVDIVDVVGDTVYAVFVLLCVLC